MSAMSSPSMQVDTLQGDVRIRARNRLIVLSGRQVLEAYAAWVAAAPEVRHKKPARSVRATAAADHPNPTDYSLAQAAQRLTRERRALQSERDGALSIAEAAAESGFSQSTIANMFESEKGVLVINRPETMHKRRYRRIQIPRSVYDRVMRKIANS
jgi:AraC-like DNA-binding protein